MKIFSPYYNTNGIPTEQPLENNFWVQEAAAGFILKEGDIIFDIETACIRLRDRLAAKIFGNLTSYHALLPTVPLSYFYGGIDAEVNVSKEEFEKFATMVSNHPLHYQLLCFYDVDNLISTLQNAVAESKYLMGQFFKTLNVIPFL